MSYIPGIGSSGFTTPANYQTAQTNSKNSKVQTGGADDLNLYQSFEGWHIATDKAALGVAEQRIQEKAASGNYASEEDEQIYIDLENFYNEALNMAEDFSFEEDGKTYNEQLTTLAKEHIQTYDKDKNDSLVSYEEYTSKELDNYNNIYGEELGEISLEESGMEEMFKSSFDFFDLNGDGYIDTDETKAYYAILDMLDNNMDGKIKFSTYNTVSESLTPDVMEDGSLNFNNELKLSNKEKLKETMTEIYNTHFASQTPEIENKNDTPTMPEQKNKPTAPTNAGKTVMAIEKSLLKDEQSEIKKPKTFIMK